jgi:hypothetical protein
MKYYSLFFIILFIPEFGYSQDSIVPVKSQNRHSGFSVSLETGLSPAFGLYYEDGLEEDGWMGGECAGPGIGVSANCDYGFKKGKYELTSTVGFNHNNYDMPSFTNEEYNSPGPGWPASKLVTNASASSYNTGYFSAGLKRPFNLRRFTIYFNLMAGFLICRTPAISFNEKFWPSTSDSLSWKVTQPSEIGFAYTISFGMGIEYHIRKNMFVLISGGLGAALNRINVNVNSTYITTIPSNNNNGPPENNYSHLLIQINNIEMGVGYEF